MCGRYRRRHPPPTRPFYSACEFVVDGAFSFFCLGGPGCPPGGRPPGASPARKIVVEVHTGLRCFHNGVDSLRSTILSPARALRGLGSQSITASALRNAAGRGIDGHRRCPVVLCCGVRSGWQLAVQGPGPARPVTGSVAAQQRMLYSFLAGVVAGVPLVGAQARPSTLQGVVRTPNTISVMFVPPS